MSRIFVLGVGAAKAGTTWLYHYLRSYDHTDLGFKKEYHVFDVDNIEGCRHYAGSTPKDEDIVESGFVGKSRQQQRTLAEFRTDYNRYFDFFDSLLDHPVSLTADITPTYLGLPAEVLRAIGEGFESRNIDLKVILLMRDPVDRMISTAKMGRRFGGVAGVVIDRAAPLSKAVAQLRSVQHVKSNGDYSKVISRLRDCYPESSIYLGFYETMFQRNEIRRLSDFLGLEPRYSFAQQKFNQSYTQPDDHLEEALIARLQDDYAQEYRYFSREFPELYQENIWGYCLPQ